MEAFVALDEPFKINMGMGMGMEMEMGMGLGSRQTHHTWLQKCKLMEALIVIEGKSTSARRRRRRDEKEPEHTHATLTVGPKESQQSTMIVISPWLRVINGKMK